MDRRNSGKCGPPHRARTPRAARPRQRIRTADGQRLLLAALGRHNERAFLALDRDKVYIRVLLSHADGKTALAAADLQMDRIVVAEQGAPLAAFFLGSNAITSAQAANRTSKFFFCAFSCVINPLHQCYSTENCPQTGRKKSKLPQNTPVCGTSSAIIDIILYHREIAGHNRYLS